MRQYAEEKEMNMNTLMMHYKETKSSEVTRDMIDLLES